jgi:hypothetical protein
MLAMVVVAALLSLPGTSSAAKPGEREAEPPATRGSPALWVPGLILLGTSWAVGANVFMFANLYWSGCEELLGEGGHTQKSVLACRDRRVEKTWRTAPVLAPVVGPFIVASAMHDQEDGYTPGMLVIGGTQVIGTALIVAGQLARRPALLEDAAEQSSPSFRSSAAASPGWRSRPASSTSFSMQARGRPQDDLDHVDVGRLLDGDGGGARASLRRSTPPLETEAGCARPGPERRRDRRRSRNGSGASSPARRQLQVSPRIGGGERATDDFIGWYAAVLAVLVQSTGTSGG